MCGLVGVAGDLSLDGVKSFKQMLYVDTLRGEDSTGTAFIGFQGNSISIVKAIGGAENLLSQKKFQDEATCGKYAMIGHNRFGTVGKASIANAHPFQHGDIVGAHNGTLPFDARRRLGNEQEFGTDSEQIIHSIANRGVVDTVALMNGAWAVTFYDKNTNTINFFRNKERDLWYTTSADGKMMFWASEPRMMMWVLERNGVKFEKVWQVPVGKLLSFAIPRTGQVFNMVNEGVVAELKEHTAAPVVGRFQDRAEHWFNGWSPNKKAGEKGSEAGEKKGGEVIPFANDGGTGKTYEDVPWPSEDDLSDDAIEKLALGWALQAHEEKNTSTRMPVAYVNPRTGQMMTKEEFDDITSAGCDWCSQNIEYGSAARFHCEATTGDIECFCENCMEGRSGLERYLGIKH